MDQVTRWKLIALVAASAAVGWLAHGSHIVHAADTGAAPAFFQIQGTGPEAQLSVYDRESRTISVYQGVGGGSDTKPCSYQYVLGRAGATIHRRVCAIGTLPW